MSAESARDLLVWAESAGIFRKPNPNDATAVSRWLLDAQRFLERYQPDPLVDNRVHQIARFCWDVAGEMPSIYTPVARSEMVRPPQPDE